MTGISGSSYLVNDPGYAKTSYTQAEVVTSASYKRPAGCRSLTATLEAENLSEMDKSAEFDTADLIFDEEIEQSTFLTE
jgi:hypothetical protein